MKVSLWDAGRWEERILPNIKKVRTVFGGSMVFIDADDKMIACALPDSTAVLLKDGSSWSDVVITE